MSQKITFPNNTVTDPELIVRKMTSILNSVAMMDPTAVQDVVDQHPEGPAKVAYQKIADLVADIQAHPEHEEG